MFPRLAEQYRCLVHDLVLSLQALARSLQDRGLAATCYSCGDGRDGQGASFVANLGSNHMVRFLVSDFGISWVESRDGHELVKFEGAEAIQELQRVAQVLQERGASAESSLGSTGTVPLPTQLSS
jgi:xanthine dehydrogenase iron-sulfur cluster and FAD-binding subunit A